MLLYNLTIKVDSSVERPWLNWIKTIYLPAIKHTGLVEESKVCRLLLQDDTDGITFAIQIFFHDLNALNSFRQSYEPSLQESHDQNFKGQFVTFRTLLEIVG